MNYLLPEEYQAFGLDTATHESWATSASRLIDGYCRRPTLAVSQYIERLRITPGRAAVRLTYLPLAPLAPAMSALVSARARFAPAEMRHADLAFNELGRDVATSFQLPGTWTVLDPASLEAEPQSGEVTLPMHPLGLSFNEIEITYTAGLAEISDDVKAACAQIARNAQATPALTVKQGKIDNLRMDYFADTLLDQDVRKLLAPYVAQKVG